MSTLYIASWGCIPSNSGFLTSADNGFADLTASRTKISLVSIKAICSLEAIIVSIYDVLHREQFQQSNESQVLQLEQRKLSWCSDKNRK